jgi:uncharacterized membrane protein (UPF0127 family)
MKSVRVVHEASGIQLGSRIAVADSWWHRLRGLLARPRMRAGDGLLLMDCTSVHTVGMTYAIDVAFLDADGTIVRKIPRLAPYRVGIGGPEAVHALELPAGRLDDTGTVAGVRLSWS